RTYRMESRHLQTLLVLARRASTFLLQSVALLQICACKLQFDDIESRDSYIPMSDLASVLHRLWSSSERGRQSCRPCFPLSSCFQVSAILSSSEPPNRLRFVLFAWA